MIKIYRKTVTIKAEQFDGSVMMFNKYSRLIDTGTMNGEKHSPEIYLMGTGQKVVVGDWIVTESIGKYEIIGDKDFSRKYFMLPIVPPDVAAMIQDYKRKGWDIMRFMYDNWEQYEDYSNWINDNSEIAARAWLDGYQVEVQHG